MVLEGCIVGGAVIVLLALGFLWMDWRKAKRRKIKR